MCCPYARVAGSVDQRATECFVFHVTGPRPRNWLHDEADVYEDYRREGEAAAEVDRLRRLAVELWGSRRNMAYGPAGEAAILAEFPFLRELERAKLEIAEL